MSAQRPAKAVFDCNVFLQALGNPLGPAGRCVQAALEGQFQLFIDQLLIDELIEVSARPDLVRKLRILPTRVSELVADLNTRAVFVNDVPAVLNYPRDPDDAHYIDLALATRSYLVVSRDKDLLDLMNDSNAVGKSLRTNYPDLRIVTPPGFIQLLESQKSE
jgi:putative PIN family toxin of toxin-antitoxin system